MDNAAAFNNSRKKKVNEYLVLHVQITVVHWQALDQQASAAVFKWNQIQNL